MTPSLSSFSFPGPSASPDPKAQAALYLQQSIKHRSSDPALSMHCARQAFQIGKQIQEDSLVFESLLYLGKGQWLTGQARQALDTLLQAMDFIDFQENTLRMAIYYEALGTCYINLEQMDKAFEMVMRSLEIAKNLESCTHLAFCYNDLGEIYRELGDLDKAIEFYEKGLQESSRTPVPSETDIAFYINLCACFRQRQDFQKALEYIQQALSFPAVNAKRMHHCALLEKSFLLAELRQVQPARQVLFEAIKFFTSLQDHYNLFEGYRLASRLCPVEDFGQREKYLRLAKDSASQMQCAISLSTVCQELALVYQESGRLKKSQEMFHQYATYIKAQRDDQRLQKLRMIDIQSRYHKSVEEKEFYQNISEQLHENAALLRRQREQLKASYESMQGIAKIGRQITSSLDLSIVLEQIYESANQIIEAPLLGLAILDSTQDFLSVRYYIDGPDQVTQASISCKETESLLVKALSCPEPLVIDCFNREKGVWIGKEYLQSAPPMRSGVFVALRIEEKPIGVLTVQSRQEKAYSIYDIDSILTLSSFIAVALNNAAKSEALEKEMQKRVEAQLELQDLNQQLSALSELDPLTGIGNRRRYDSHLQFWLRESQRCQRPLSLISLDVDLFKAYNDRFGHIAGDEVLCQVAKVLQSAARRENDLAARYGGDEFALILPFAEASFALETAQMLQSQLEEALSQNLLVPMTISVGLATASLGDSSDARLLMEQADQALYQAKQNGRGQVCQYVQTPKDNTDPL